MAERNDDQKLAYAVASSLALHAVAAFAFLPGISASQAKPEKLQVELRGVIAEKQKEARSPAPAMEALPPAPHPVQAAKKTSASPSQTQPVRRQVLTAPDSPRKVFQPPEQPPNETASASPQTPSTQTSTASSPDDAQKQTTLNFQDNRTDELRQYLVALKRKIQRRLVYPQEAKKAGYEGSPVVKFTITETGAIRPGSLVVSRSSGHADLDASALKAAQASEPFDKPPRVMEVGIELAFVLRN